MNAQTTTEPAEDATQMTLRQRILAAIWLPIWVLAGFIAAALIIGLLYQLLAAINLVPVGLISESLIDTIIAALIYALSLVIVIGVPWKLRGMKTTKEELGLAHAPTWKDFALAPAGFIVYLIIAGILTTLVTQLIPAFDADQAQDVGFSAISKHYEYVLAFITIVVLAPIGEEVLVRGYLYGKLRKFTPIIVATLISSALFALMHFQWNVAVNVLPLAIVMSGLREMTGSIWAGILLHMLKNGIAFYLLFINPSFLNTMVG